MRLRNIIGGAIYAIGAVTGIGGLAGLQADQTSTHAMMLVVAAITFMCAGVIYLLATDDTESRHQMVPDEHIDLRARQAGAPYRQAVHA